MSLQPSLPITVLQTRRLPLITWNRAVNTFCFVKLIDCFGQSVGIAVSNTANRGFNTRFHQALNVIDR
jgi:hypothetical protein